MIRRLLPLLVAILATLPAFAHRFEITDVVVTVERDGTLVADVRVDVDALALGVSPERDNAQNVADIEARAGDEEDLLARATGTLERRVRIRFDGEPAEAAISFPEWRAPQEDPLFPSVFGTIARFTTKVPADAEAFTFRASRAFGPVRLRVVEASNGHEREELLVPGGDATPWTFGVSGEPGEIAGGVVGRYLWLGFTHILPLGLDHILFVVGLFLLSKRWKPLLLQITAFTVAHTVTLALSIAGVVSLPSRWVEALIALSIAYVAVENLFTEKVHSWRLALVFSFGLLHGLGFAGVLRELGLPEGRMLAALLSFNVGVEIGQLAVVGLCFLLVGWARRSEHYRSRVVVPASLAIAATGLFWTVQRAFF